MTEKISRMLKSLRDKEYRKLRVSSDLADETGRIDLTNRPELFEELVLEEKPVLFEGDSIGFNRHIGAVIKSEGGNVTPDYYGVLRMGLGKIIEDIELGINNTSDKDRKEYGMSMLRHLKTSLIISNKYREYAKKTGNIRLYNALNVVPEKGAGSFYEALVFLKFIIFVLRLDGKDHITLGRFDQYMYDFFLADKTAGVSDAELFESLEEFFISLNYDTDLYMGIQQGDNGQSMVLGGFDGEGNSMYNELSKMCMDASLELLLIDPKINLRVGRNTPDEIYEFATLLTKQGLGFPQYCNDDVVVSGLEKLGYSREDALEYTVAACWEYIIPGYGADIPNLVTMDFPRVVNDAVMSRLSGCDSFDELMEYVRLAVCHECECLIQESWRRNDSLGPLLSAFMKGGGKALTDMRRGGARYYNFGCHGAGIANAADALSAVRKNVFDKKALSAQRLIDALNADFEGYADVRQLLKDSPKMGNNDDYVDDIAKALMDAFSGCMNNRDNGCGGIWRAGTGSAMEYLWKGEKCPATADGRRKGEPYSSSFSPSLDVKASGLLSVIQSFTKYDMTNIINGGPLTIEIHDTVFRNDIGIKKTAMLVKSYILLGGHQLQLNTINRERLLDAQLHPENHPNLITRVWGWSGYFNELDVEYQNHIIRRCEFTL